MTEKVAEYERLLKELMGRVSDPDAQLIRSTLEKVRQDPPVDQFGSARLTFIGNSS